MRWIIIVLAVAWIACTSAQAPEPEPTPTPTATATSTPTPTPRATFAVDPSIERKRALYWAARAAATPRPVPTQSREGILWYPTPPPTRPGSTGRIGRGWSPTRATYSCSTALPVNPNSTSR